MILFTDCPRCGGDIDASTPEDVHCVQCGDRPQVSYPGPVILGAGAGPPHRVAASGPAGLCPRCGTGESMALQKVRPDYNTCYRCRRCSHVYSP